MITSVNDFQDVADVAGEALPLAPSSFFLKTLNRLLDLTSPDADCLAFLKDYIEEGLSFNPAARDEDGNTEFMQIAFSCGLEGQQFFFDHGGQLSNGVLNQDGNSEYMLAILGASYDSIEMGVKAAELFFDKGGQVNASASDSDDNGWNEWTFTAGRAGADGLKRYAAAGGKPNSAVVEQYAGGSTETAFIAERCDLETFKAHMDLGAQPNPSHPEVWERAIVEKGLGDKAIALYDAAVAKMRAAKPAAGLNAG